MKSKHKAMVCSDKRYTIAIGAENKTESGLEYCEMNFILLNRPLS
ncbi:MAG: hypothetical protein OXC92_08770 [Flavobacteriaceae bacterium]|nr:hypothetical protein [Flavobacteriaceae bacterium]MCY4217059.1 hypothetical protein [Flavobacteriaceae bacterium]